MILSKPILKYNFADDLKHLGWIMLGVLGFNIVFGVVSMGTTNINGFELLFGLILLIGWAGHFEETLHFYAQHGVSRRTIFANTAVGIAISSALFTVALLLTIGLLALSAMALPIDMGYLSVFATFYTQQLTGMGIVPGLLLHFVWAWAILMVFSAVGQFGASLYYILSKLGRYIALGVIIFTVVFLPRLLIAVEGDLIEAFVNVIFYGGDWGRPGQAIVTALCVAAACLIGSWLCMRRCQMKK